MRGNTTKKQRQNSKQLCPSAKQPVLIGHVVFQVRARTSAGYGAFSRRFEFQTSPYCEYSTVTVASRVCVCVCDSALLLSPQ